MTINASPVPSTVRSTDTHKEERKLVLANVLAYASSVNPIGQNVTRPAFAGADALRDTMSK
ncbi:hypothetical protein D3C76_1770170 [compost metagenome]